MARKISQEETVEKSSRQCLEGRCLNPHASQLLCHLPFTLTTVRRSTWGERDVQTEVLSSLLSFIGLAVALPLWGGGVTCPSSSPALALGGV